MHRLLFQKTGNAVWISHLDLMRLFQRAFKRAGLHLKHTQGFNPRPSVSIALPLSVGVESECELLEFELDGQELACDEIKARLNPALTAGITVLEVYESGRKYRDLSLLLCEIILTYDAGVEEDAADKLKDLFAQPALVLPKKTKSGIQDQDIIPMIRRIDFVLVDAHTVKVTALICCQNPTLNPGQIPLAISTYLPELAPSCHRCRRLEIYDPQEKVFR